MSVSLKNDQPNTTQLRPLPEVIRRKPLHGHQPQFLHRSVFRPSFSSACLPCEGPTISLRLIHFWGGEMRERASEAFEALPLCHSQMLDRVTETMDLPSNTPVPHPAPSQFNDFIPHLFSPSHHRSGEQARGHLHQRQSKGMRGCWGLASFSPILLLLCLAKGAEAQAYGQPQYQQQRPRAEFRDIGRKEPGKYVLDGKGRC